MRVFWAERALTTGPQGLNPTFCVRRGKVSILSGCNSRPAALVVPAGSNRSGGGGNEAVGAFDGKGRLLALRKKKSARGRGPYTLWYETQRLASGVGTSPHPRRATRPGRVLHPGSRRVPRCRPQVRSAVGRRIPAGGWAGAARPTDTGAAAQIDDHTGEGRPSL